MIALLTRLNLHLGDTPSAYLNVPYAGLVYELPITITWVDTKAPKLYLAVDTQHVETWGGWLGHPVFLNDVEIGRVIDPKNIDGGQERTTIELTPEAQPDVFKEGAKVRLKIAVEKKNTSQAGLLDDFLLTGYATDGFAAKIGW